VDLRHLVSTFTIDPESSQDRDDAFSVEDLIGNPSAAQSGARWRLHLHVTDVASVIQPESPLWESAVKRGASIYLGDRVIPMLPDSLSTDALSLLPNQDRGAITFSVDVAEDFSLIPNSEWFNKTVISVNEALVFQQADQIISEAPDHPITVVSKIRDKLDQLQKEKGGRIPTQENFDYSKTRPADGETFNFDRTPLGSSRRMVATLSSLYSEAVAAVGVSGPNPVEARPAFGYSVLNDFDHDGKLDPILSDISANNLEGPALNYRLRAIKGTSAYATTPREHERTGIVSAKANSPMRSMSDLLNQHQLLAAIDETVQPIPEATLGELLTQISVTQSGCRAIGKEELLIARNSVYNDRINSMIAAGEKPEFEAIVLDTVTPGNDPLREKAKRVYIPEFDIEVSGFITYANKADLKRPIRRGDSVNVLLEPLKDIHSEEIFVDPVRKVNGNRRR
jgi:exoribonuclease R